MQFPITIGLRRSRLLDSLIFLSALSASTCIALYDQPLSVRGWLLLAIWLCSFFAWRRLSPQLSAIRLEHSGGISIASPGTKEFIATELLPVATVHPWLVVARLRIDGEQTLTLVATVDSMNDEDFRRLRVFLRWQAEFSVTSDDA